MTREEKAHKALIQAACEAQEMFTTDELEAYADSLRPQEDPDAQG